MFCPANTAPRRGSVLVESRDRQHTWGTVGVSVNIIEASWQALVDSITYKLMQEDIKKPEKMQKRLVV